MMEENTGYIITEQNANLVANLSGKDVSLLLRNKGWVAVYMEDPYPVWHLMPRKAAERIRGFKYVDSLLNGLPARSEKEIREEWAKVNKEYSEKVKSLNEELQRRKLWDEELSRKKHTV
jgi:hypothetical protein